MAVLTKGAKPNSAGFVWIERLTAVGPTRERIIYRKSAGAPSTSWRGSSSSRTRPENVIIIHDASGVPEEITSEE